MSPADLKSCKAPDQGPWAVREWSRPGSVALQSKDLRHEVALVVDGVFDSYEERVTYANELAAWLNQQVAQSAESKGADAQPDVVADPLIEAPEPKLAQVEDILPAAPEAGAVEPTLDNPPTPEPQVADSLGQRVTKLIHSTNFPLGRKPVGFDRHREHTPVRVEKPAQELDGVVCEPMLDLPRTPADQGQCACHFDLQQDQAPDDCAIDLGHPECCTIAASGVLKELCPHWLPIRIVPRRAAA